MQINGTDVVLKGHGAPSSLLTVAAVVWMEWEDALFQDAAGTVYSYMTLPLDTLTELFMYRDQAAMTSWANEGMTDENADAMIYAIIHGGDLTVVVHDADEPETRKLLATIRRVLNVP